VPETKRGWIFKANETWIIRDKVRELLGQSGLWRQVPSARVRSTVGVPVLFLQCGKDTTLSEEGVERGFYGIGTIEAPRKGDRYARVRYEQVLARPLLLSKVRTIPSLSQRQWGDGRVPYLFGLKARENKPSTPCGMAGTEFWLSEDDVQGLNVVLSSAQLSELAQTSNLQNEDEDAEHVREWQGYATGEAREIIERHAMERAEDYLKKKLKYDKVIDQHKGNPFDFRCESHGKEIFVEVKGTTGKGKKIILTRGEYEFGLQHRDGMALFILHSIRLRGKKANGGTIKYIPNWQVEEEDLKPIQYMLQLV